MMRWLNIGRWMLVFGLLLSVPVASAAPRERGKTGPKQARITWSEQRVKRVMNAGTTETITLTMTSSAAMEQATLQMRGGLGRITTITPAGPIAVAANTPVTVTLTVAMPADAKHGRAGTIVVRAGKRNVPRPLRVAVRLPHDREDGDE